MPHYVTSVLNQKAILPPYYQREYNQYHKDHNSHDVEYSKPMWIGICKWETVII